MKTWRPNQLDERAKIEGAKVESFSYPANSFFEKIHFSSQTPLK
jgi:hypothetical protein